ncbi:uncharacterized protein LOC116805853 [Drosophila grimshawi]|uniref:GH23402 n=1 Tax=Drosophila grimshawi TaxID=7222 RepID=B4K1Z1_DROGR|nr:uncharacterized protein LOC116805853 [Drosophila grimshawi]EDW04484.1 GH23402 [Drosophila grimshawi]
MSKEPEINANNWPSADQLSGLWVHLIGELSIRTLLYYQAAKCRCWIEQLLSENNMTTSTLVFDKDSGAPYLKSQHNVEMMGLICLEADGFEIVLSTLSVMLNQMREVPLLIQICTKDLTQPEIEGLATQILRRCQELLMPNVLLLLSDFFITSHIYGYQYFPAFRLTSHAYRSNLTLYPNKLDNLYGHVLRAQPDLLRSNIFMYRDGNGKLVLTGALWHLVKEFARHLNASLQFSFEPTKANTFKTSYYTLIGHIENRTTDIACGLFAPAVVKNDHLFSYPVFSPSWCIMLPVDRVVSPHEAIFGLLESPLMWICLGILYFCFHWLHGRRIPGRRLLQLIPLLIKLSLICSVVAQLSALFIHPQKLNSISNWEKLSASGLQIKGIRADFHYYPEELRIKYASSFISIENHTSFQLQRDSFNVSFGYTVVHLKWRIYAERQKHFKQPLFRYSKDLCFRQLSLQSLAYQENSIYRHELNLHILWFRQSGLLLYLNDNTFYDMVGAGYYSLKDLSQQYEVGPLTWSDCSFIGVLYAYAIGISLLVFVLELVVYYINVCLHLL